MRFIFRLVLAIVAGLMLGDYIIYRLRRKPSYEVLDDSEEDTT